MHRPALDPVERGRDGGGRPIDKPFGRENGRGLEGDGGDGGVLAEVAAKRACGLRCLVCEERSEQRIALFVRVATIVERTAGADVLVEDLTAEELKQYRLEGTDEQIPLLEEVLELFQDRTPLIIELKAERGNHAALAEATCRMLDRYRVHYCIESFDPRCLIWLKKNRPEIVRGQLSEQFLRHGETAGHGKATMWLLGNLFSNVAVRPDFIAYRFSDRDNLCLRWCRKFYHVQEVNWTIRTKEEMEAAEAQGNLVIFECFDPKG